MVYLGAELLNVVGPMENTVFTLNVSKDVFAKENQKLFVDYKIFMKKRQTIKEQARVSRGLPARYHKSKSFTFEDIAH